MQEHTQSNSVDTIESYSSAPHSSKRVLIVTAVDAEKESVLRGLKMRPDSRLSRAGSVRQPRLPRLPAG